jgi:hypothetical protein
MEVRWISALVGGRALSLVLRNSFFAFRVIKVCRSGARMVVATPRTIRISRLQPHLGGNIERLVEVVCSSRILSGCGNLWIVKELHRQLFLLLRLRGGCGLHDPFDDFPFATSNVKPIQGGAAAAARHRHGLEVEDEGLLKDLVIFIFIEIFCTVRCFF